MTTCISCKQTTDKYKCPNCLAYYCSVPCFSAHKANVESCVSSSSTLLKTDNFKNEPAVRDPFKTEDTVPTDKLEMLKDSDELKNLLYNPHLRNLLNEINRAPNAQKAMQAAMQEPLFLEFADACLKVIEPPIDENET